MLNAENKDQTGAFRLRNLNLSIFYWEKKDSHYENESSEACSKPTNVSFREVQSSSQKHFMA